MNKVLSSALARIEAGDLETAHALVQALPAEAAAWVHAHLHRAEGDEPNARYWYGKAKRPFPETGLAEEREAIRAALGGSTKP